MAGDLLPTNRTRRRSSHRSFLPTSRDITPHEIRRAGWPTTQKESLYPLGNAESMAGSAPLQIPQPHHGSTGLLLAGLEHVLAPNTDPLRPQPALQPHHTHPIWSLLPSTRLWLHPRNVFRWPVGRPYNHKMDQKTRDASTRG